MTQDKIENLLSKEALQQLFELRENIDASVDSFSKLASRATALNKAFSNVENLKEYIKALRELGDLEIKIKTVTADMVQQHARYNEMLKKNADVLIKEAKARDINASALLKETRARQIDDEMKRASMKTDADMARAAELNTAKIKKTEEERMAVRTRSMIAQEKELERLIKLEEKARAEAAKNIPVEHGPTVIFGADASDAVKKTGAVVNDLDKAQAAAANSATAMGKAHAEAAQKIAATPKVDPFVPANEMEKTILLLQKNRQYLENTKTAQKELKKELDDGIITRQEYNKATAQLSINEQNYKNQVAKLTKDLRDMRRESDAAKGSLEQRRAALIRLNAVYDNLSPQERASASGQRLQKILGGLTDQVKTLESATGRNQRNVGNYPTVFQRATSGAVKFGKTVSNLITPLRVLANILPGVGLAGAFAMLLAPLGAFASMIRDALVSVSSFGERMKVLAEVNSKAAESYSKQMASASALVSVLKDGNIAVEAKERALKDLIALDPAYLSGLTLANIATEEGRVILTQYNDQLRKKAELTAAGEAFGSASAEKANLEVVKDLLRQRLNATQTNFDDLTEAELKYLSKMKTSAGRTAFTSSLFNSEISKSDLRVMLEGVEEDIDKSQKKVDAALDIYKGKFTQLPGPDVKIGIIESLKKQISELEKQIDTETIEAKIPGLIKARDQIQKQLDDLLGKSSKSSSVERKNTRQKLFLEEEKAHVDNLKSLSEIDTLEYSTREKLRKDAARREVEILKAQQKDELSAESEKLYSVLNSIKAGEIEKANARSAYAAAAADINNKYNFSIQQSERKLGEDIITIRQSSIAKQREIEDKAHQEATAAMIKREEDRHSTELATLDKNSRERQDRYAYQRDKELVALEGKYLAGTITEEQYNKRRLEIEVRYNGLILQEQIWYTKKLLEIKKASGKDVTAEQKRIKELELEIARLGNKKLDGENKQTEAKLRERVQLYRDVANELADMASGLAGAGAEREKNRLQEEIDLLEERKQKDIEVANQTIANEQEKAAAITTIEARANAQRQQLERQQRQAEQERARFEKAAGIARIIVNTASSIMSFLALTPPNVPGSIAAGAIGAAQLVKAIATPIPKYGEGTDDHPGGPAMVGDRYRTEYVIEPGGKTYKTPSVPTVMDISAHAMVVPSTEAMLAMGFKRNELLRMPVDSEGAGFLMLGQKIDSLARVIKSRPIKDEKIDHSGYSAMIRMGMRWNKYIDDNVNF